MARKQKAVDQNKAQDKGPGMLGYEPVPSSRALTEHLDRMPYVPDNWRLMHEYITAVTMWRDELRRLAYDVCAAANDATGLMADILDGRRKIDDAATQFIAQAVAIRA